MKGLNALAILQRLFNFIRSTLYCRSSPSKRTWSLLYVFLERQSMISNIIFFKVGMSSCYRPFVPPLSLSQFWFKGTLASGIREALENFLLLCKVNYNVLLLWFLYPPFVVLRAISYCYDTFYNVFIIIFYDFYMPNIPLLPSYLISTMWNYLIN